MGNGELMTREEVYDILVYNKAREILDKERANLVGAIDYSIYMVDGAVLATVLNRTIEKAKRQANIYAVQNTEREYRGQFKETSC